MTEQNLYPCYHCDKLNNALQNNWCLCVTTDRTLVCEHCGECFCQSPALWQSMFWTTTSPEMRQRAPERKAVSVPKLSAVPAESARPLVLIVDDDRVVHVLTSRILDQFSGTVMHCHDGGEALELAKRVQPDLVITDALLPTLDGRELARTLKQSPETSGCKVAVMTGLYKGQRYRAEAFREFMVDEYLEKPIDPTKLRALVASIQVAAAPRAFAAVGRT